MAGVELPDGYHRTPATDDVVGEAAEHLRAVFLAESGRPFVSLDDYASFWRAPYLDLDSDVALVRSDAGDLVAQAVVVNRSPHTQPFCFGAVSPEHHDRGLGSALLAWEQARARERIGDAPPDARVAVETFVDARHERSARLLADHGYAVDRYFMTMEVELDGGPPPAEFPAGFELRTWDESELEAGARTAAAAFQDHYGFVERPIEERVAELRHRTEHPLFDPELNWHLYDGGELVAVNWCNGDSEGDAAVGYVQTLGVRRPWRGRGLARNLLLHAFGEFQRRGKRRAALDVDAHSITGATRLYESVGMAETHRTANYVRELRDGVDLARRS